MIVCLCFGIDYEQIQKLVEEDKSLDEITAICGAGLSCGACVKLIQWEIDDYERNKDKK